MAKIILNRDFGLAGETIHDHKCSFYVIFLLGHDALISCRYFMTFYDEIE